MNTPIRERLRRRVLLPLTLVAACGGAQAEQPAPNAPKAEAHAAGKDGSCGEYARRLCVELGPGSDGCRAVLGVLAVMPPAACGAGLAEFETTRARIAELRKDCERVAERVCSELGEQSPSCKAIRGDLPEIPPGHCAALHRDQERLIAVLKQREALSGPLDDARWSELLSGTPPGFGAADAKVVVVQFSDFQCPFCAQAAETVRRLKQDYETRIRFVFRQFPLAFHEHARGAAQASLAAHEQGKFWEYHDALFANQDALDRKALLEHAKRLGLDVGAFSSALDGGSTSTRVSEDLQLGEEVQVQGTPTLFVNRQRISDPLDYEAVSQAIDRALNAAQEPPQGAQ